MFHRLARQFATPDEAAESFGVSQEAAQIQWKAFSKDGIVP